MKAEDLKPGPELDALVAEKVMGWSMTTLQRLLEQAGLVDRFCPSTSIADAMEAAEKVWKRVPKTGHGTYRFQLSRRDGESLSGGFFGKGDGDQGKWVCEFAMDAQGDWRTHSVGSAPTAPMAICLAALRAVGAIA